jgi:hypothetical protein
MKGIVKLELEEVLNQDGFGKYINEKWINPIKLFKPDLDINKTDFYASWGFFHPGGGDRIEYWKNFWGDVLKMTWEERLESELSRLRVNMIVSSGKNFKITDRIPKDVPVPEIIIKIVTEVVKVKMLIEWEYNHNDYIKSTIPPLDNSIISFEIIRQNIGDDYNQIENLDIDSILDKISESGMDSLSPDEKEFLERKSKGE